MAKILVLYYSSYGHVEAMATAVAQGVREAGSEVCIKRVPELVPDDVARKSGIKLDQPAPFASVKSESRLKVRPRKLAGVLTVAVLPPVPNVTR